MASASSHDVVIVGAGPSGSTAALALARAGKRVALLDRVTFPRVKTCGNCLHPRIWKIWDQLDLAESFRALPHCDIAGFDIQCEGRPVHRLDFSKRGPRSVSRYLLDDWLLGHARAAGVEFFPSTTVNGVDADSGLVRTSNGDFRGRLIFGADGRNSVVARHAGLMPKPQRCHRVAWQAIMPAPPALDRHVYMQVFEEGYYGYCRYGEGRAVISMVLDARRSHDPAAMISRFISDVPAQEWLRMNPITRAPAQLGRGRVWLIGDSARVVEPFTGEGMSFALMTGLFAAEAAGNALKRDELAPALAGYAKRQHALYRDNAWVNAFSRWILREPRHIVRVMRRISFPRPLVSLLSRQIDLAGSAA